MGSKSGQHNKTSTHEIFLLWHHRWKGDQPRISNHLFLEEERVFPQQYIYVFSEELLGVLEKKFSQKCKKRHKLRIFLFLRKVIFRPQDCIFNRLIISKIYEVMMSISTWDREPFWTYPLNHIWSWSKIWVTFWLNCGHWYKVFNFYQLLYQFEII